ncbi:MAG: fumarylacetoacetate hydrolase family protein [Oligoflexia bacterium]|nr:fumarylacetoacetate hydrolase family protein [Oligoflexia bacterium]MBF0367448.1 fumarylacetoacetate hydrolase family protein [Oligoflexia bacterium]
MFHLLQRFAYEGITPSGNIYCIGQNYVEHIHELKNELPTSPVVFLKAPAALRAPSDEGVIAFSEESFHHEVELVLMVGHDEKFTAITLGLDLTRREVQSELKKKGLPWSVAKSFAGSALLGHWRPMSSCSSCTSIDFSLSVNGEKKQQGNSELMIYNFETIRSFLRLHGPLYAGDIVFTGTPAGVGPIKRGDCFTMSSQILELQEIGKI